MQDDSEWQYMDGLEGPIGPMSLDKLRLLYEEEVISRKTLVSCGDGNWGAVGEIPGFLTRMHMSGISDAKNALDETKNTAFRILKEEGTLDILKSLFERPVNFIGEDPSSPVWKVRPAPGRLEAEGLLGKFGDRESYQSYYVDSTSIFVATYKSRDSDFDGEHLGDSGGICVFHNDELVLHINDCFTRRYDGYSSGTWEVKDSAYKGLEKAKLNKQWMNDLKKIAAEIIRTDELKKMSKEERSAEEAKQQLKNFDLGNFS